MMYDRIMILLFDNYENLYARLIKYDQNDYDFRSMQFNIMTSIRKVNANDVHCKRSESSEHLSVDILCLARCDLSSENV